MQCDYTHVTKHVPIHYTHVPIQASVKRATLLFLCRSTTLLWLDDGRTSLSLRHTLLACAPYALVGADAPTPTLLAFAPLALVGADARPPTLLANAPYALVGTDVRPPTFLARAPLALVGAEPRPSTILASAPSSLVGALGGLLCFLDLTFVWPR